MIPVMPSATDIVACTTDAVLLQLMGQAAIPLHILWLESRLPMRLPRRVVLGVLLRPFVCRVMFDDPRTEVPMPGGSGTRVIQTGQPEATLEYWPSAGQGRAV